MRFINDNVKLKHGGRTAVKISKDELWKKIVARARAINEDLEEEEDQGFDSENDYAFISELICCDPIISKDIKFAIDCENILTACDSDDDRLGMQTCKDLTYYALAMGGDWEIPVFMIIYYDGKKLRAYIPSYGNLVNLDCKCAFGSEGSVIDDNQAEKLLKKYKKLGIEPEDPDYIDWSELYCQMYGETRDDAEFTYWAMSEDIQARIVVTN